MKLDMIFRRWLLPILCFFCFSMPAMAQTTEGATISIPDLTIPLNEMLMVNIQIDCPAAVCAAVDLTLVYDPTMIMVDSFDWGSFPSSDGKSILTISQTHDPEAGMLRASYVTLESSETEIRSGDLLTLTFYALSPGSTTVSILQAVVGTPDGLGVEPVVTHDGTFTVTAPPQSTLECPGDVDGNGVIDLSDLNQLLLAYTLAGPANTAADVNADGEVNILDVIIVDQHLGLSAGECGS